MLCPAQVTSRSTSDLLVVDLIAGNTTLPTPVRMELIAAVVAGWDRATAGSTGRALTRRDASRLNHFGEPKRGVA